MSKTILTLFVLFCCTVGVIGENDADKCETVPLSDVLEVTAEYPHSTKSFTQGLFFINGEMYETTGRYGESRLYKGINITDATYSAEYSFDDTIFAEGSTVLDDILYVLTYKENKVLLFNPDTLECINTVDYPYEGWGITTDGETLIASDGSSVLRFFDKEFNLKRTIEVTVNGEKTDKLNELEYIDGKIYANRWLTNDILVISPENGRTEKIIDASILSEKQSKDVNDVLNGIAYNKENGMLYLTGKRWDTLFECRFKN